MSRKDFDDEIARLDAELAAERDRLAGVLERGARMFGGKPPKLRGKHLEKARALRDRVLELKAERSRRARQVPREVKQRCRQEAHCLDNLKATIAALRKRGKDPDRLAEMEARLAAAEQRVADAEAAYDDALGSPSL